MKSLIGSDCSGKNHPLSQTLSQKKPLILCLERPLVTVCGLTHIIIFHLYVHGSTLSVLPSCCCSSRNTLWLKLRDTANGNTHTVHHIHVDNPSPGPPTRRLPPSYRRTHGHKNTHICCGHQTLLILSQDSQQRRFE